MRVITGTARGRRLLELEGQETRPTTDRVKEGLFSALQFEIEGARVLDLFAGTGQLGIECLSRGAASATFVDMRGDAVALVKKNLVLTDLADRAAVINGNARDFVVRTSERFDLIFLDPPYGSDWLEEILTRIAAPGFDILRPCGIIAAEHPIEKILPALPPPFRLQRTYRYGRIAVSLFRRDGNE